MKTFSDLTRTKKSMRCGRLRRRVVAGLERVRSTRHRMLVPGMSLRHRVWFPYRRDGFERSSGLSEPVNNAPVAPLYPNIVNCLLDGPHVMSNTWTISKSEVPG